MENLENLENLKVGMKVKVVRPYTRSIRNDLYEYNGTILDFGFGGLALVENTATGKRYYEHPDTITVEKEGAVI